MPTFQGCCQQALGGGHGLAGSAGDSLGVLPSLLELVVPAHGSVGSQPVSQLSEVLDEE